MTLDSENDWSREREYLLERIADLERANRDAMNRLEIIEEEIEHINDARDE